MRKSSKMLSLVIALIFLFSAVTPALALSAAAPDAGARLKALGVIAGYPDGSLGLERNITRAEMTVVLAEMYGMSQASEILKSVPPKFSDVASNAWYTGYINLAQQQGWVAGYPDGSFKPNATVTYAEAITMMMNLLGYKAAHLPGTWPLNYIVKAADLKVTSGVSFTANATAPRGDVFVIASKTLDQNLVSWNSDDNVFRNLSGDPLLISKLDIKELEEGTITDAFFLVGSALSDDDRKVTVEFEADDEDYKVSEGVDLRAYVGVPSVFYVNKDEDTIVAVKSTKGVTTATIKDAVYAAGVTTIELTSGTKIDVSVGDTLLVNDVYIESATAADVQDLASARGEIRYRASSRNVSFADVVNYSLMESEMGLVKEVAVDEELVDVKFFVGDMLPLNTDDDQIVLYGVDSLSDISKFDVVYWNTDGSGDYAVYVVSDAVSGAADRYTSSTIRIAGTTYDLASDWIGSKDNAKTFSASANIADFSGENVTAYIDGYGDVYALSGTIGPVVENVAVVDGAIVATQTGTTSWKYTVELYKANGTVGTYEFKDKDVLVEGTKVSLLFGMTGPSDPFEEYDLLDLALVEYSLNNAGKIDKLDLYDADDIVTIDELDKDEMNKFSRIEGAYITSSTVFFDISAGSGESDDWSLLTWADVKAVGSTSTVAGEAFVNSDGDAEYVVFTTSPISEDDNYAVVLDTWKVGSGSDAVTYVEVASKAGIVEYVYDGDATSLEENDLIRFDMSSGEIVSITVVGTYDVTLPSAPYDSLRSRIKVDDSPLTYVDVDADTVIVNNSGSTS